MAKENPSLSVQTAPVHEPLKIDPKTTDALKVELTPPVAKPRKWYWFGALPAAGEVKIPVKGHRGEITGYERHTARQLFDNPQVSTWAGKCQFFQNISLSGAEFVAWTDEVQIREGGQTVTIPKPGGIARFDEDQIKSILANAGRRIIREISAVDESTNTAKRSGRQLNLDVAGSTFNPRTDRFVASFVYMVPLNVPVEASTDDVWAAVPSMKEFFGAPPPSLLRD